MAHHSFPRNAVSHPPSFVRERHDLILTPAQAGAVSLLFQLRAATQLLETRLDRWLREHSLTLGRFQVMNVLRAADRPVPQREVVLALQVSRATVSDLVRVLVEDGHATSTSSRADKREVLVELTASGARLIDQLTADCAARLEASMPFDMTTMKELTFLLTRLSTEHPRSE